MNDPQPPSVPNILHPQAKALGKNKLNNPQKKEKEPTVSAPAVGPKTPVAAVSAPVATPKVPPSPVVSTLKPPGRNSPAPFGTGLASGAAPAPGKDKSYFELTIKLVGSDEPPFVVETVLTGDGAADKASAIFVAMEKHPRRAMTIINSRIYQKTENALSEIAPGSTLSALFGAPGESTGDLIEIGRAFHDGSRGAIFLRNLKTHIGLAFRPSVGGLIVYSNRVASNRLASELPQIVAEIFGNGAREIQIYLK